MTDGERHDLTPAYQLLEGLNIDRLIAGRGYSAQHFVDYLFGCGIEVVILFHQRVNVWGEYDQ